MDCFFHTNLTGPAKSLPGIVYAAVKNWGSTGQLLQNAGGNRVIYKQRHGLHVVNKHLVHPVKHRSTRQATYKLQSGSVRASSTMQDVASSQEVRSSFCAHWLHS